MFRSRSSEVIHRSDRATLYRGKRGEDGRDYVVKSLHDAEHAHFRLQREHEVLAALSGCEGVIRSYGVERERSSVLLLLESFPGESLQALMLAGAMSLARSLDLVIALLHILERVHLRGVVHAQLRPSNVLVGPNDELRLIDFAEAMPKSTEWSPGALRATTIQAYAYTSPEQIGRLPRAVDQRSDLYAVGVMLFELVTGQLPFAATDPLQLAHAHVARPPPDPRDLAPEISPALARVLLRLLSKEPDGRYSSAEQLRRDLEVCRGALDRGQHDFDDLPIAVEPDEFRIRNRLYGRQAMVAQLEDAIERAFRGHATIITLEGGAGVGKTALANEMRRIVSVQRGYWVGGKFEADSEPDPLSPLRSALQSLSEQLATSRSNRFAWLPGRLEARVPGATRALLAFCPSLRLLLFDAAPVELERSGVVDLVPRAAGELLRQLCADGHPICLFFDDVQWATGSALLALREVIAAARLGAFAAILAHRGSEPQSAARCGELLAELGQQGFAIVKRSVDPLSRRDVQALVRDTFLLDGDELAVLAEAIFARSEGNPLFLRTFVQTITRTCTRPSRDGGLEIDVDRVRALEGGADVGDLLGLRVRELPEPTRSALAMAACLGRTFDLRVLREVLGASAIAALMPAVRAGIVAEFDTFRPDGEAMGDGSRCRFTHDRCHQAVLAQLDESAKLEAHVTVGRFLLADLTAMTGPRLFEALVHLNRARSRLSADERLRLIALDLQGSRLAAQAGHGELALALARDGIEVLGSEGWATEQQTMRELHVALAEAAFGWAEHDVLANCCATLRAHARSAYDRVEVLVLEGRFHQSQQRSAEAIRTYLAALQEMDVDLQLDPDPARMGTELRLTAEALRGLTHDAILSLSPCTEPHVVRLMALLSKLVFFSYAASNALLTVAACRMVRLSLTHGHTPESANGYAFYGLIVARDHDLDRAVQFAKLAIDLAEYCGDAGVLSNAHLHANYQLMHWKVPFKRLAGAFLKAYNYGLLAGSPTNASCSATTLCICKFWSGHDLAQLASEMEEYRAQLVRFKQRLVLNWHEILMQLVNNLRGGGADPSLLIGAVYDERERLPVHLAGSDSSALFNYYIAKALLCLMFGDTEGAVAAVEANVPYGSLYGTSMWAVPYLYLDSLCRLEACLVATTTTRAAHLDRVDANLEKLRSWCPHNPEAVEHRLRTLEAMRAVIDGRIQHAGHLFAEATELARQAGPHDEALTCELAGRFWLEQRDEREARSCIRRAHRAYFAWGAIAKARTLEVKYGRLLGPAAWRVSDPDTERHRGEEMDALDLVGVLAASRAIASEIRLDALLERLMALLIETAGAEFGYLLLPSQGDWVVAAGVQPDGTQVATLQSLRVADLPRAGYRPLRLDAVEQVTRTGQPVLLEDYDAPNNGGRNDRRGSILCFPLKRQGSLEAVAYLENRLLRSVFTRASVAVLEILSGQAVVALQNARLYQELEERVLARTQEARRKNQDLEVALSQLVDLQHQLVIKEKLAAVGALTASIAHEIKNPLNFVTNFAEIAEGLSHEIVDHVQSPAQGEGVRALAGELCVVVRKVAEHGRRAAAIVDSMAMHSPRSARPMKALNVNAIIREHIPFAAALGEDIAKCLELDLASDLVDVPVLEESFGRAVVNLLSNAFHSVARKRTENTAFLPRIALSTCNIRDHVELRVWDNGLGIAPDLLEQIFLPFVTTKTAGQGTGLGLSICYDIVVRGHGGTLTVRSTLGEFAEFTVRLPRFGLKQATSVLSFAPRDH
jgi:histidine kinase